ncbi:MAG TPA: hypothetical protein VN684_10465 [Terriglobales bacterium]|nr:hypothetical protein [Terriglobales bacterium]
MNISLKIVALLLLLVVVLVLVSPTFNLGPTALRASRAAQMLVLALVMAASLTNLFSTLPAAEQAIQPHENAIPLSDNLLSRLCARLC